MAIQESPLPLESVPPKAPYKRRPLPRDRREALARIKEMSEHHTGAARGGQLRAAIFGINDGLVTNVSLVVGVAAADPGRQVIILAGMAGMVAGAFSMAVGEYISMQVQREVFEAQIALERTELSDNRELEREEMAIIFIAKGLKEDDAFRVADQVMEDPEAALEIMAHEELGLNLDDLGSPWGAAISSFTAFAVGAVIPLLPFILLAGLQALIAALVLAGAVMLVVGGLTARLSGRPMLRNGLRNLGIGAVAAGVTYGIGNMVGRTVK